MPGYFSRAFLVNSIKCKDVDIVILYAERFCDCL